MAQAANRSRFNLDASDHRAMIYRRIISNRTADHGKVLLNPINTLRTGGYFSSFE